MPVSSSENNDSAFIALALRDLCGVPPDAVVLDFGCGRGALVRYLRAAGFDAWGCDNSVFRSGDYDPDELLKEISTEPYRLPFGDATFDAVVSTSVLEHARNKEEIFREIHRVLRPGGATLHMMPSKWYLPVEPHCYVPLVNWMWPNVPHWWLLLWALLGVRNEFDSHLSWREVARRNQERCATNLHYWTQSQYRRAMQPIFGNCAFPHRFFLEKGSGGAASLARRLPGKTLLAWALGQFRMTMLMAVKAGPSKTESSA